MAISFTESKDKVEVRAFLQLDGRLRKIYGKPPWYFELSEPVTGRALAERLNIPVEEIEVIFINGFVQDLHAMIHSGDRIAFLPPGCPGPYRIALGFYDKNQNNPANFRIQKKG